MPNNDVYGICDKSVSCNNLQYSPVSINLFVWKHCTDFINFITHFLMQRFTVTGVLGAHGVTVAAEELTSYVNATIHPPKMEENRAKGLDVRLKSVLLVRFSSVCRSVFRLQK